MSTFRKSPVNDTEKAVVLHASAARLNPPHMPPPVMAPADNQGPELDLIDSLQRHWLLAICVFTVIAVAGIFWSVKSIRPVYQAETTIYIPTDLVRDNGEGSPENSYRTLVNQQIMTILHYDVLSEALHRLSKQGVPWKNKGETERQAVDRLRNTLEVQRVPDSYEVSIQVTSNDPHIAASVANTVAQSYLDEGSRSDALRRNDKGAALFLEKATMEKELRRQLDARSKLAESLQVVNLQKSSQLPDDQVLIQLREALATAHSKRIEAEARLAAGQSTVAADAAEIASASPAARTVESQLLQRQFELRERIKSMLPTHPVRKEAEAELASIDAQLKNGPTGDIPKVTAQLMAKLRSQADEARRVETDLTREIAQETTNIPDIARNLAEADLVNGEIARIQDHLSRIEAQIAEDSVRNTSGGSLRVFSVAQAPNVPLKSHRSKAMGIVLAMALLFGLGLPLALDLSDSRIYDPSTVERILGFPVVGMTIERTTATEQFADEHLRRLVSAIERGIADGAKIILLTGLKQPVAPSIMRDISGQLSGHGITVVERSGRRRLEPEFETASFPMGLGVPMPSDLENGEVVLADAPALVFSAEAERLAMQADMTFVVVQSGMNTRRDLVRGARLLDRLNVPAVGVILQDVRVERAGRSLRRDLKEYTALQRELPGLTGSWAGW